MDCPNCGLINPPSAQRCDCGYDFAARTVKTPYVPQEERGGRGVAGWVWWILGAFIVRGLLTMHSEGWITLAVIALCGGLGYAFFRHKATRRTNLATGSVRSELATEDVVSAAEPAARPDISNYYLDPHPELAPDALTEIIERGGFQNPENVVWYLFVRIARDNPWLVRRYEALFRENPAGRPVLLTILQQVGDEETRRFLESCVGDPQFEPIRAELQAVVQDWPADPIDPLTRPVSSPADLDLLWCEFCVTGRTEPVLRIIDVFERPDHIRGKLEDWLHAIPRRGFSILGNVLRKLTIRRLWQGASILCDAGRREVLSPQDLDCHCTMQNMCFNQERTLRIAKLLPFSLYGEDAYILLKDAARWSLASHAHQHPIILRLCESEAAKRSGRCRILLLEIVAYAALARQDLETAFNALQQSLTSDTDTDLARKARAAAEWERLLKLSPDSAAPDAERLPAARDAALRCVCATQAADTYRTMRTVRQAERTEKGPGDVVWECEFARPANFHVFQTMWWESGPVYDEWITVGGKHFRGPVYVPTADDSKSPTSALLASGYFKLLRKRKPAAFDVRLIGDRRYLLFQYRNVPAPTAPRWGHLAQSVGISLLACDVLVWAEFETARLAKVVQTVGLSPKTGERMQIEHLFCCYDEPVSIVPPAFGLMGPRQATVRARVAGWLGRGH